MSKAACVLFASMGLAFSSGTAAQYVSATGGPSYIGFDCSNASDCDHRDTAFKAVIGVPIWRGLGVEVGYVDWGRIVVNGSGQRSEMNVSSVTVGAALRAPISPSWEVFFRLGVAHNTVKVDRTVLGVTSRDSDSTEDLYQGIGFRYALTRNVKFELGVDFTRPEYAGEKKDVQALTAGVTLDF